VISAIESAELRYVGEDKSNSALSLSFCFFCVERERRCAEVEEEEEEERGGEGERSLGVGPFMDNFRCRADIVAN
jgi:hypothetical protein